MLQRIDRLVIRVPNVASAVAYYRDVLGMTLIKEEKRVASLKFSNDQAELILHSEADLPAEAAYILVQDLRDLYQRREELQLKFSSPPTRSARGFRATVRDPFGTVLQLIDRSGSENHHGHIEDAKAPGALFEGVDQKVAIKRELLVSLYEKLGRTADDLPYTPHFESLFEPYVEKFDEPKPDRAEVWRHLLNLRKAGNLPKLGEARSRPPKVDEQEKKHLRELLGEDIGKRDRLPYTARFDQIVDAFNRDQEKKLSPHLVWRLVATLAK